jgi:glycosyltransferase involved in cell wall biosynthesis
MPTISIITPLHNKELYLADTIKSVINQTYTDWEMIIVENGSTDNGLNIARSFDDERIKVLILNKRGPGAARNMGINHSAGEWILFLDADDMIEDKHIEVLLNVAKNNTACGIVAGGWKSFYDNIPNESFEDKPFERFKNYDDLLSSALSLTPWVPHVAIVKKSIFTKDNLWPEELDNLPDEDTAFWFTLLLSSQVAWSATLGALYRLSAADSRSSLKDVKKRFEGYHQAVEYNLQKLEQSGATINPKCWSYLSIMYETHYRNSMQVENSEIAAKSLCESKKYLEKSSITSLNILARKLIGIKNVNKLRAALGVK